MNPTDVPMGRFCLVFSSCALFLAPAAPVIADPETDGGASWELDRLDVHVDFDGRGDRVTISGAVHVHASSPSTGPTLVVNNREPVMRFHELTVREHPEASIELNAEHPDADHARLAHVRLPETLPAGTALVIDFVLERTSEAPQAVFKKGYALVSWVEAWYPVPLVAGADPISAAKMTAAGTTTFRLPAGWKAVTNGAPVRPAPAEQDTAAPIERASNETIERWNTEQPVARAFVAGPFEESRERVGDLEIGVYLLSPKELGGRAQAHTLGRALGAMEARFGPYPYPSYAIAEVPESIVTWYAASEQGYITARTSAFEVAGGNVPLFAHEAAHGWWGNLVNSAGPGDKLCSESLAQYGAVVAIETLEGAAAMRDFLEFSRVGYSGWQCATGYFGIVREGADKPLAQLRNDPHDHNLSDSKGHWFYHMLRLRLGDDVFFGTLRELIDTFAGRDMRLDDVRSAFLAAAPDDPDLARFLAEWLDRTGAPVLSLEWWTVRRGAAVEIRLAQTQPGEPYLLDVELEIRMRDGSTTRTRVDLRERTARTEVETPSRAVDVRLDPDVTLLTWRPRYGPVPDSLAAGR